MILITVGTEKFPFDRLMLWVKQLIDEKILRPDQERIVIQYGSCTVVPDGTQAFSLLPAEDFKSLMRQARLIIAHCGEGTLNTLLDSGRPFVLVPRSHRFGEHVDNHQLDMAQALSERNVPVAYSPGDLARFIAAPPSPARPLLREYQLFVRWGVRCPEAIKDKQYTPLTQKKAAKKLCLQLSQRFAPGSSKADAYSHSIRPMVRQSLVGAH